MKLKRCFKTVLSSVLAAAMLITAVPSNLTLDVQAAPTDETAVETVVDTEESTVAVEEVAATEATTENTTEETTTEAVVEEKEETVKDEEIVDVTAYDISSGYWGPTIGEDGAVTIYYYPSNFTEAVTSVQVKGGWVSDWSNKIEMTLQDDGSYAYTLPVEKAPVTMSFEYGFQPNSADDKWDVDDCNPTVNGANSKIMRNPQIDADSNVTLYYYPEHGAYPDSVKVKYKVAGAESYTEATMALDSTYTKIYSVKLTGLSAGNYEYVFDVDGTEVADTNNAETGKFSVVSYKAEDPNVKSPVVEGKSVTFNYYGPTASKVQLAGNMNGWSDSATPMTFDPDTCYWSVTQTLAAGSYSYKFVVDNGWITDPLNTSYDSDGNSVVIVTGLEDQAVNVTRGGSVELPATLKCYAADGATTDAAVTYALADSTVEWASTVSLTAVEGVTTLATSALPAAVKSFDLTATDAAGNTSKVVVTVVDVVYNYTIYYYDATHATGENEAMTAADSALWIWENNGGSGVLYDLNETEVLKDGKTWAKTTVSLSYTDLMIIPKNAGSDWVWQDKDRHYNNEAKEENVTLYIVYGDGTAVHTELPEIKEIEKRYLVVEYTRTSTTPENWYFYTWNSGYGSNVFVPFEEKNGKWTAVVPVMPGLESISYCIERATVDGTTVTHWAEKDGNDYNCAVPADQKVVKIQMEEGKGITYVYPYNSGYEFDTENKAIHFYYRNEEAFLAGSTGGAHSVQVEIEGTTYDMTFNEEEQRYVYDMEDLKPGTYKYRYIVKATESAEVEYLLDAYNEEKVVENDIEYSVCTYDLFKVKVTAKMNKTSMDYNDNNVLSVKFTGKNGADVSGLEVASATVDLTAVGGSATAEIDPALMELSISVKEGTKAGKKTIPVTVIDQYGNEYKTSTSVKVVNRNKGNDFDWDEAVIYFTVTDRFFDGNASNNGAGYDVSENGPSSYHGGDFAGLTAKLDYLSDLGVNTIWITPIVENAMEDGLTTDVAGVKSWGYHGYWASDFTKLDSHLGTEAEFAALLDAAHARGMKIMVDVVLNHSGYSQEEYFNSLLKDEEGNSIPMIRTTDQMISGDDQKSSLSGLPDFLTENEEVRNLLVEWQSNWISKYDIDYYRVDTVKHVDDTTWSAFKNALTKINPDFKMIGEWAGAGYATDTGMLNEGRMDSLLDFDFNGEATEFVKGDIEGTENFLNARNASIDNTATLGAFIGSHDEPGFAYALMNPEGGGSGKTEEEAMALTKVAASLQITAKGQVVIYYGEEVGQTGANNYPYQTNRYDFDWSLVNDTNDTLSHYKKMLDIRERYSEVFAKGARTTIEASNEGGYDVFAKSYGGKTIYTALNIGSQPATYTFTGLQPGVCMVNLYNDEFVYADKDGNMTVTIPAAADGGTAVLIESDSFKPFRVETVAEKIYTGKKITLTTESVPATDAEAAVEAELKVYYGNTLLEAGTDYKVAYKNNTNVGTATITVTGKGNYSGKETTTFVIVPRNLADTSAVKINYQSAMAATGKTLKPLTSIVCDGKKVAAKEYKVEYFAVTTNGTETKKDAVTAVKNAGDYEMVITGKYNAETGKGNFTGSVTIPFKVYEKNVVVNVKNLSILVEGSKNYSTSYTGKAIEPTVTVTKAGTALTKDVDYIVTYANNTEVGNKASITITGIPEKGYIGSVTKTFKITGTALKDAAEIDTANWKNNVDVVYVADEGKWLGLQNGVTLKAKDSTNTESITYEVSYLKNDKPGKATMVFTGTGAYTGKITKTFTVNKMNIKDNAVITVADKAVYMKKGAKATVSVSVNGIPLVEGKDYKVKYSANKAVTAEATAKVTITGKGSFNGTDTKYFKVDAADLATATVTAADAVYQNKKGKYETAPVVKDAEGTKLVKGKDYTCSYYLGTVSEENRLTKTEDIVEAGKTIVVVIEPASANFTGKNQASYEVQEKTIAKVKVKIAAQVYTGEAIKLTGEDIKITVGRETLVLGKDYTIVEDSYDNNTNKGTASVTLEGLGNYGGTKTVTFKITSRTVAWWWNLLH